MGIQERRQREREARRDAVLDAARSLLKERGFNGTTTKQIAKRAELSEATLFWYFKTKDEIMISLFFEGVDFMSAGLERVAKAKVAGPEKLAKLWKFFGKVQCEHPEYIHVFTYLAHPHATAGVDEEVKSEILHRSGENFDRIASVIREGTCAPNARVVVDLIWSAFMGMTVLRDTRKNLGASGHPTERDMAAALKILVGGLMPN